MSRITLLILIQLFLARSVIAQNDSGSIPLKDTLPGIDTAHITLNTQSQAQQNDSSDLMQATDSVSKKPVQQIWILNPNLPLSLQVLQHHPYFGIGGKPVTIRSGLKPFAGKEVLFYALIGFLLGFALLREAFPKYFNDLVRLLFRNTLKQKQISEQLMQTPLPSLLLNAFFAVSGGLYIDILLQHFGAMPIHNFWLLFLYCSLGLSVIYLVKYLGLKITGWLFNIEAAADAYIFVVYIINKVIGVFLLPFLVLLSFLQGDAFTVAMICSFCGIAVLLIYRFLLTYTTVRNQVRFNPFHFFLYLCAFEIAPLLLIYKALLFFFP